MSGLWKRLGERWDDPRVVRQHAVEGCGVACGQMLLADRHVLVDQEALSREVALPTAAEELAACLNTHSPPNVHWRGGALDVEPPPSLDLLRALGENGSWAVLLKRGRRQAGHWVVVDRVTGDGALVRDPAGSAYLLPYDEFLQLMGYLVVVFDRGAPS